MSQGRELFGRAEMSPEMSPADLHQVKTSASRAGWGKCVLRATCSPCLHLGEPSGQEPSHEWAWGEPQDMFCTILHFLFERGRSPGTSPSQARKPTRTAGSSASGWEGGSDGSQAVAVDGWWPVNAPASSLLGNRFGQSCQACGRAALVPTGYYPWDRSRGLSCLALPLLHPQCAESLRLPAHQHPQHRATPTSGPASPCPAVSRQQGGRALRRGDGS
ncbi:hypothetical protein DR999_PMT22983 [Platysternon megacephalum]|uniref:Uncharacterized protein n=1 Tax=Platysternon megacephalum TaxID=55544 RepID=A0A4D9DKM6_9SAUR|nr:hypothetical protein DR999_PMT22983 [Platysternon megacephalum]